MNKICKKCNQDLSVDKFTVKRIGQDGPVYQYICKECNKIYQKEHYKNNKKYYILKQREYRKTHVVPAMTLYVREYKEKHGCTKCGDKRWYCLDFHHLDSTTKLSEVSRLIREHTTWIKLKAEISKCILLCSNCHRELHYLERLGDVPEGTGDELSIS